jgi:hypothetical protein
MKSKAGNRPTGRQAERTPFLFSRFNQGAKRGKAMQLPETPFLSITEVAKRLATTEEKVEQYLKSNQIYASIDIKPSLLESCDGLCDHEVLLGGYFELSGYQNIYWDENGTYDLHAGHLLLPPKNPEDDKERRGTVVFLRKLAGDPLQYKDEWINTGKLRSLRYMWRLGAYGHKVYRPACSLVINRKDIFIEAAEVKAFEFEMATEDEQVKEVQTATVNEASTLSSYKKAVLKEVGKRGGEKEKENKPVIEAVKKYFGKNVCLLKKKKTAREIAKKFCSSCIEKKPMRVDVDGFNYEVYYEKNYINVRPGENHEGKVNKKRIKLIALATFEKNYISKIKTSLLKQDPKS